MAAGLPTSLPTPAERESPFSTSWSRSGLAWVVSPILEGHCCHGVVSSDLWAWSSTLLGLGWGEAHDCRANWKLGEGAVPRRGGC